MEEGTMMKNNIDRRESSPCSVKNIPFPEILACPHCGDGTELWSDEEETICQGCGSAVARKQF
jgi:hypothetical protein